MNWQALFRGYSSTPLLWEGEYYGIKQLEQLPATNQTFLPPLDVSYKLGHLVEKMVEEEFSNDTRFQLIDSNIQFNFEGRTIGEMDFLVKFNDIVYQVECSYKFYLYDPTINGDTVNRWIGPNRKDALILKLNKLIEHQFTLYKNDGVKGFLLKKYKIETQPIPRSIFKGQLFLPLDNAKISGLNKNALAGFYLTLNQLKENYSDAKFHQLSKYEWLLEPITTVEWKSIDNILPYIEEQHQKKNSPMLWMKKPNGVINKCFIVWW